MKKVTIAVVAAMVLASGVMADENISVAESNSMVTDGVSSGNTDADRIARANERFKSQNIKWTLGMGKEPTAKQLVAACMDEDLKALYGGANIIIAKEAFTNYIGLYIAPYVNMETCDIERGVIHLVAQQNDNAILSPLHVTRVKK